MASEMPAKASIPGLARAFFSVFDPGATFSNTTGLHTRHFLDSVENVIHDGYHAAAGYITHAATRSANPVEPVDLELANNQQADDLGEAGTPGESDSTMDASPCLRSSRERMRMAILIVGVLSLIVVPGLVLGVMTKQLPWGIALCGLIATVVSFFASFYYYLDK